MEIQVSLDLFLKKLFKISDKVSFQIDQPLAFSPNSFPSLRIRSASSNSHTDKVGNVILKISGVNLPTSTYIQLVSRRFKNSNHHGTFNAFYSLIVMIIRIALFVNMNRKSHNNLFIGSHNSENSEIIFP